MIERIVNLEKKVEGLKIITKKRYNETIERIVHLEELKKKEDTQPKPQPEVTARQIINEWYYTEEERKANES
jgi:hypothetical protein